MKSKNNFNYCKKYKEIQKRKGFITRQTFKIGDVAHATIIKIESGGITNPTIEILQKIAKAFNVSVDDLIK
ncbi:MAG: helix-turn-helix transcriptional regulator [Patescibacteria group bacterium]